MRHRLFQALVATSVWYGLGIEDHVGTIAVGKDADLALFSAHPLDMYSLNTHTWIDGQLVFDRSKEGTPDARP